MKVKFRDELGHELDNITFDLRDTGRGYTGLYMTGYCKKCKRTFGIDMSSLNMSIVKDKEEEGDGS